MTSENFENHNIFDRLKSLEEVLSNDDSKEKIELEKLSFFQTIFSYTNQRVKLTIPDLLQQTELDALSNELNAGTVHINNFIGDGNVGHLNNATNNFIAVINRIKGFPIPVSNKDFNFSRKIAEFENTVKSKYKSLEKQKAQLETAISEFEVDLEDKEAEIQRLLKLIESKETEIQNLTSTFRTDFENIKSAHNQSFQNDRTTFRNEIDSDKEQFREEIDNLKKDIDTDTSELVENLNAKLEEAKKIVNVIGNVGVTGNYQNIANEHKRTANFWRWVAIGFMAVFSGLLIWTLVDLSADGYDWTKSLLRLLAAAALSYPATYAAKESSKHRKLENINRTAELELSSVDAFIEMLDNTKKQDIKARLVDKYFGNDKSRVLDTNKENEELSVGGFEKIIDAISKFVK